MSSNSNNDRKYKGVRRRKWGKWVSEIRVPGTQERLWLGSYSSAEAAAVAHDVAYYCLRRPTNMEQLNIPSMMLQITNNLNIIREHMSPCSIQKAASDAAMAVDAHYISSATTTANQDYSSWGTDHLQPQPQPQEEEEAFSNISIEDYL